MPVRNRRSRRRVGADYAAWAEAFEFEYDFFRRMADAGIPLDAHGRPDREQVRTAWKIYGRVFLEQWHAAGHRHGRLPWALEEFGTP